MGQLHIYGTPWGSYIYVEATIKGSYIYMEATTMGQLHICGSYYQRQLHICGSYYHGQLLLGSIKDISESVTLQFFLFKLHHNKPVSYQNIKENMYLSFSL